MRWFGVAVLLALSSLAQSTKTGSTKPAREAVAPASPVSSAPDAGEDPISARARVAFTEAEVHWKQRSTGAARAGAFKSWVVVRQREFASLEREYGRVADLGSPFWTVAARTRIGMLYAEYASDVLAMPDPPNLDAEQLELYRSELAAQVFPTQQQAKEQLELAIALARRQFPDSPWLLTAQAALDRLEAALKKH